MHVEHLAGSDRDAVPVGRSTRTQSLHLNEEVGIIYETTFGFWTVEEIDAHFDALEPFAARVRRRHGRVRIAIDLRNAPVQSQAVADRVAMRSRALWRPEDRVALVVGSAIARIQMSRVVDPVNHSVWIDAREAVESLGPLPPKALSA